MFSLVCPLVPFKSTVNTYAPLKFLDTLTPFYFIFMAVTNAFAVNGKKSVICITDEGEQTYL